MEPAEQDRDRLRGRRTLLDVALGTFVGSVAYILAGVILMLIGVWLAPNEAHHDAIVSIVTLLAVPIGLLTGVYCVRAIVAARVRRLAYERALAFAAGVCPVCGYSLRGLPEPRCPECGERFSEAEYSSVPQQTAAAATSDRDAAR